jgi:phage terminase small subunit
MAFKKTGKTPAKTGKPAKSDGKVPETPRKVGAKAGKVPESAGNPSETAGEYERLPEVAGLRPKWLAFVLEYMADLNATAAAIRCGYSEKSATQISVELMARPQIKAAVSACLALRAKRSEITADYVLEVICDTVERCRQAEPVKDREGKPTGEYKFDAQAVLKGAELLGKHIAMFTEKIAGKVELEHSGEISHILEFGSPDDDYSDIPGA